MTCKWKTLHSHTSKVAATICTGPFSWYPSRKTDIILPALTNRLFEHERLFYREAQGCNSHAYFSSGSPSPSELFFTRH